ncbi:hypothetical protein [Streptomyces sp. NPDC055607]
MTGDEFVQFRDAGHPLGQVRGNQFPAALALDLDIVVILGLAVADQQQ